MPLLYDYTNVYSTALTILRNKGFQVWRDPEGQLFWAERDGWDFASPTPTGLLGLIAIFEYQSPMVYKEYWWRERESTDYRDLPTAPARQYTPRGPEHP
jgi:hypothetical protein